MNIENGTIINQYKILSEIGKGGMGEVYLAQDTKLNRKVAIKFLNEEFSKDSEKLNRFIQEAQATSALNHPNILTVYGIDSFDDTHYIATEFIEGETLREVISKKDSVPLNQILKIGIQTAEALSASHTAGIAHRDIKPENVMIREDGYVKVLDFGLAKLTEEKKSEDDISLEGETKALVKTNPGVVMGTVSYMSPEQARGKETDAKTDIWSLGVVLYEMLSGKVPFAGETINHTIVAILEKEPKLLENVPDELQRIIRKTLTKEKGMRYQTSADLVVDLKNLRRELDIQGELERSIIPNKEHLTEAPGENETQVYAAKSVEETDLSTQGSTTQNVTTASSLEYAVTQAKSNKLFSAIAGLVLIGIISAIAYFAFFASDGNDSIESIAVMPFVNESGNEDVEYLSDGMTETLISSLSKLPNLQVKPRSSVFRYKGKETDAKTIGQELNVQAILNGRVVKRGEQLTLSLELIDVQKDVVLWSERYNRKQTDLVKLQSEIAKDVSTKLKSKLSGAEEEKVTKTYTTNPEAYQAYLKGRYYWNRRTAENLKKAIEEFKTAADKDPNYALAYVGLADCYTLLSEYAGVPSSETLPKAKAFAEKALSIDSTLAEPHATLGLINFNLWKWDESEKDFKRAIELNPNYATTYHWYSILLNTLGRYGESAKMIKQANRLDPLSSVIGINISRMYQLQNNHKASIQNSLKILELDPNFAGAYYFLGMSYLKLGRNAEAVSALEKQVQLTNRAALGLGNLGYVYAATGKQAEAIAIIKELETKYSRNEATGTNLAAIYAGLGDKDKAFEWLEKDFQARSGLLGIIEWAISFESLRDDPRFKDLLNRMGLPE